MTIASLFPSSSATSPFTLSREVKPVPGASCGQYPLGQRRRSRAWPRASALPQKADQWASQITRPLGLSWLRRRDTAEPKRSAETTSAARRCDHPTRALTRRVRQHLAHDHAPEVVTLRRRRPPSVLLVRREADRVLVGDSRMTDATAEDSIRHLSRTEQRSEEV